MKKNMKQTMRILTLLALALFSSGRIWAASVVSMDVTGGQLKFFSDEACTTSISEAEAGSTVYIKAIPDYGYTGNGATFAAVASVGSNQAESRRAVHVDETLPFGGAVEVRTVDNTRGIYSLTMPDDTGVAVSATLATVTSTTVSYVDEKYETHTVSAVPLDLTMTVLAADQWYFVGSDITFDQGFTSKDDEIEMMRNRCIVVADGATFTIGTKDAPLENHAFYFGGSLFLYGQKEATGKLSINSEKCGTDIGGCFVIANLDVDVTSKSTALSGSSNGNGSFIAGHPTKGNTVTVRNNNGWGINAAGKPLVIKNCNVDVDSKEGWGINTGGVSLTIEGLAKGTSSVKIHSSNNGINVGGATATIKYCDIDIVSDGGHGIYGGGSPVIIEGVAKGTNNVKVRSKGNGIYGGGHPVTIKYCDVDVVSTDNYGISANYPGVTIEGVATGTANKISVCGSSYGISCGGGPINIKYCDVDVVSTNGTGINANYPGVTIEGRSDGSNALTVRSAGYGIYGGGCPVTIKYCNVEVTGATQDEAGEYGFCGGSGIYEGGGSGMSIIGSASGNNTVVVRSCSNGIEGSGCPVTIQDCTVDVIAKGEYGIYSSNGTGITIDGLEDGISNTVKVRSAGKGIFADGCPITINNCDVTVTGLYNETTGEYGFCGGNGIFESYGSGININGCASGNTITVRSNGEGGIYGGGCPVTIQDCTVDVIAKGGYGLFATSGTGLTINGLADGSNTVTVRCPNNGIFTDGYPITINNCDVTVTGLYNETTGEYDFCSSGGIYENDGSGMNINGCTSGNTVTVRSNGSGGIYGCGCPVTIKNCTVDVISNTGGYGIYANGGTGITIEGLEDGSSDVTVRCLNNGLYGWGYPIKITNCNVTVTGLYNEETGEYNPCGANGIYDSGGDLVTIVGHTENGNTLMVKSTGDAIYGWGCRPNISNCDVDLLSTNGKGINVSYYGDVSITSTLEEGNTVKIASKGSGVYGSGCSITITNCDVDVTSTDDFGLYATSYNGLSLTSTLEDGNKATVKSKNSSLLSYGNDLTIDNYTVDINSESYGIYGVSKMDITNSDVTIESQMSSIYFVGSNGGTISDSRITATTTGTKQDEEDYNCYDGIFVPNGITISGSQVDVSAQEGNWGINVADSRYAATLSWTHATDYFLASSYAGPVKVAEGQMLTDGSSLYSGELTEDEMTAIGGMKLQPGVGVTFAAAGYATYYDSEYDLMLPAGMQAYVVTDKGADEGTLKYETIADGDSEQNIVPAGTAVMLKTAESTDGEQTLAFTIGNGADAYNGDNLLDGCDTETEITTETGWFYYKLTYGEDNTTFGWYWGSEGGQSFTAGPHKAWLTLPANVDARFLGLPDGEATAIAAATQEHVGKDGAWYTVGGVKLDGQPTAKGLYIKDGKKVVIK